MGDLFSGLEKFGLGSLDMDNLFDDEPKKEEKKVVVKEEKVVEEPKEQDYLLQKTVTCPVCDHAFQTIAVKASKARRVGADRDLRPHYQGIDTLKYNITSCPYCGYTSMNKYFQHLSPIQIKMIREGVSSKFQPSTTFVPEVYTYEYALDKYKLSLYNTVVKRGKVSEKAYTCLNMAWLCRGKAEEMIASGMDESSQGVMLTRKEEMEYYQQAYDGLLKAVASESFPICGMDSPTMDMLLAQMSFTLGKFEMASKIVSRLLTSSNTTRNIKDKALDLKQEIIDKLKGQG